MNLSIKKEILIDYNKNQYKYYIVYTPMHSIKYVGTNSIDDIIKFSGGKILRIFLVKQDCEFFDDFELNTFNETGVPISSYCISSQNTIEYIPKTYIIPLEGTEYTWGENDCYGLVRTYFRQKHGIYLGDYDRDETYIYDENDIVTQNFEKEGFEKINDSTIKKEDILVFGASLARPQHFTIFLGNSRGLNHPLGRLSRIETITDYSKLKCILRYKGK